MGEPTPSVDRASKLAAWTLFQALLLHFWKFAIPFVLAGLTAALGYLAATPLPMMWILFATAGVFAFAMTGILAASMYWQLKTDAHKLRINKAKATRVILKDRDSIMFEVELQNLATFPIHFEITTTSARIGNTVSMRDEVHLSRGCVDPQIQMPFRSASVTVGETMKKRSQEIETEEEFSGYYQIKLQYGARPHALKNRLEKKYKVAVFAMGGVFRCEFRTDAKNLADVEL